MSGITVPRNPKLNQKSLSFVTPLELDSLTFVLFGATGDLAKRKIYPSLFNLFLDQKLPISFAIIGLGRREWSDEIFQKNVEDSIKAYSRRSTDDELKIKEFTSSFRYISLDVTNTESYQKLLDIIRKTEEDLDIPENRLFYLSVSPEFFDVITANIKASGLGSITGWKRLIIEKPFGHDLKSARALHRRLSEAFEEDEIYLIDHYLGKPMVQNIEALEFANPMFKALWNNKYIANVQITASETVGVEERASYYDKAGAIRDMIQNHMLQLVMMTAMHQPKQKSAMEIRNEKRKVMESLRPLPRHRISENVVRGQYQQGIIHGLPVPGYREEPGIESSSLNDTFVAARLWIDDSFWSGVPFYIRTGKRMREKSTRIVIEFKQCFQDLYKSTNEETAPNLLIIEISPHEGISLQFNSKNPVNNGKLEPVTVKFLANQQDIPEAYELLLADALRGDCTFFVPWAEVELSWAWVQPILEAFQENNLPLSFYPAGSMGPDEANQLLLEDGFKWW
ncbi:glucose-6-phosphate dehydrogenase [Peribacillus sp. SCS-155]|uniref:glucose-6-phosphate dehydrogenase n=1 Tax=Peribacillus sedimenti TaxID=3115297 RepID=UPI0039059197